MFGGIITDVSYQSHVFKVIRFHVIFNIIESLYYTVLQALEKGPHRPQVLCSFLPNSLALEPFYTVAMLCCCT